MAPVPAPAGGFSRASRCLVTGATGYIGGRLVPRLLERGHEVRCLVRDPGRLRDVPWAGSVETARGDVLDARSLRAALDGADGIDVAYYLVHSIGDSRFAETDRRGAQTFAAAARDAGVRRIVFLGGMAPAAGALSSHLRSRSEVAQVFLDSGVPTVALQAAVVIGSGSASFEMLRYLTERLPAMVTPTWVRTRTQPIAVRDVLHYLVGFAEISARVPASLNRRFDIGGPDVLTYESMMQGYAAAAGLRRRLIVPVPVLSPTLSSHWVGLVTPVPGRIARPLVESLRNEVVCRDHDVARSVADPPGGLLPFALAVEYALARVRNADVETRWSGASWSGAPSDPLPTDPAWSGGSLYEDTRERVVAADRADLWTVIAGIGGENGWYSFRLAWAVRGQLDRLVGGVGLRRGRRHPEVIQVGESIDFWRVEEVRPGELLRLRAEMRVPGLAWLELGIRSDPAGEVVRHDPVLVQHALFHPRGLAGHLYWWSVAPFHGLVFGGMVRNLARAAEGRARDRASRTQLDPDAA